MKKALFFLVITMLHAGVFAQGQGGGSVAVGASKPIAGSKITGTVLDAETQQPVEFATVALAAVGTEKPLDGTVCDDKGKFTISKVNPGTYDVIVSFIGYETQTVKQINVPEKKDEVNLGVIKLSTGTKVLKEVVVEGQKALIEERVDRTVYNAENDQTARGGDGTDVLKRVPMLSVDLDGNVTMRGSSNVRVLINNKPSTIMASSVGDALKQIPADQIKSVEVITSPSAKYDAEGSAGIINIITKKNTLEGLTLGVDAGVGTRGSNLGLNGNYRRGKMGFSLGGWGRSNYNVKGSFRSDQITQSGDGDVTNIQSADTRNRGLFGNYNLGWDYDINDKNYMTASVRFGARNGTNFQDNLFSQITNSQGVTSSLRDATSEDLSNSVDANVTFTHLYEKPQRELSIMGSYGINNRTNFFENILREQDGAVARSGFKNDNDSYNEEITFQVDYQTPISTNQMLEFGGKDIVRKVYSNYTYLIDSEGDGTYIPSASSSLSNNLNYDQNVVAGYLSYTYTTPSNYSFKGGARYEYTTIDAYTQTEDNIDIPAYGSLVPSLNISKKFANGKTVKAAYNRRIQRPSIRFLNPNIQASNPYDITEGNPTLDPEYTNNYELSYSTFIGGTTLNFSTFWRNTNNAIQDVRNVIGNNPADPDTVRTTYRNIGQEDAVGLNFFANVNVGKLSLNGGTDLFYSMLKNRTNDAQSNATNSGWVMGYRLFGSYNLSKGWGFQFFGFYRGRQVQLQGTQGGFGIYSLGLKKDFNNKKGSVGFGAENFFTPEFKIRSEVNTPTIDRNSMTSMRNMSFRVNFSYRIGKMSVDSKPKRRRSINNDDLKEGGGGDMGGGMQGGGGGGQGGGTQRGSGTAPTVPVKPLAPVDTAAQIDATGSWNYTVDSPQGGEGTLVIKKEGAVYSGTINNKRFSKELPLSSVKVNGNELSLEYEVSFGGNTMMILVKAIITGDTFSGNMAVGQFGTFPIQAKKN
ncbi:TonB-dependent receptor domain-containing protein [Parachryseolinea silvisoli]|uniref:TonB-dependent receptor domain-containing protein n=1 Tax=Parachryseolinea silvisoli TaxID=2873601 RepID=UPI002265B631|nr:TonB-dependent receptor [Parachryseolinea silvisoli]MCD9014768.1 TonB-dependent receptor [Parachryseolinea silvisoli]